MIAMANLDWMQLTPFVTNRMKALKGEFGVLKPGMRPGSGEYYLRRWEEAGSNV